MQSTGPAHVELLVDGEEEGLLSVALNTGDLGLQWHAVPPGGLRAMRELLSGETGPDRALHVGEILGAPLHLVLREGIFSLKSIALDSSADLFRFDLPPGVAEGLVIALDDAIDDWEE